MDKVLIAVKSCWRYRDRRDACRKTWVPVARRWATVRFYVGMHAPQAPFAAPCSSLYGEQDVFSFPLHDDFKNIAPKIRRIMLDAVLDGFNKVVVVDDDTYIVSERLQKEIESTEGSEYIGLLRTGPNGYGDKPYMQGSCYIINSKAIALLASDKQFLVDGIPDDVAVGLVLLDKVISVNLPRRFWVGPIAKFIGRDDDFVSTHKCNPEQMLACHAAWNRVCKNYPNFVV